MRKKMLAGLLLVVFFQQLRAQRPEDLLARWGEKMPIEKAYLHFDRDNYLGGETAWFKAYLYSDYQPDTISTSVYVELVNAASEVVLRKICPVFLGVSSGQLELPDTLTTGSYIIRAYTPTMLNADPSFIFRKSIYVFGKKAKMPEAPREKAMRLEFFPEGGNLVAGLAGTVAFKATDENGLPVSVNGRLKTESNKEITSISSYHDGMGMFEMTAAAGEKYYVVLDGDAKKYYLPAVTDKGISLTIIPHPQGNFFEIHQRVTDPAFQVAYMIGQMQHHIVFRQDFRSAKENLQGVINTKSLHSGVLQITFFNKDGMPLAERLCFVNNKEYIEAAELITDTLSFAVKGKNRFTISLKDTVTGSLSVSITDPEYQILPSRPENIYSTLLLSSDLKGYIHRPSYYFSSDNDSVQTALDLVMMTNGWRRFKWSEISSSVAAPVSYKDLSYITLSGKVTLRDVKRPFSEKQLLIMLIGADSARSMQMVSTDKQGLFRLDSMLFFGNTRILFSDTRGKKNQYIDVTLSADSLTRSFSLPVVEGQPTWLTQATTAASSPKWAMDYDAILKASGTMLEGVTLKVRKKTLLQEMDEKYASGMFSGDANKTIDLVNTTEADSYPTIFDYLQNRVPGLDFTSQDGTYVIYYRQTASASSMGPIPMIVYLNEIETDASVIATIPSNQIAFIKVFSNFVGAVGNGAGGVLAIYTKKDADITALASSADMLKYKGYSVVKEFYAPDYSPGKAPKDKVDNRITLDWRPDIFINHVNPRIPVSFYNSDRTKAYKVVIEGVTTEGKLIWVEKLITPQGARPF